MKSAEEIALEYGITCNEDALSVEYDHPDHYESVLKAMHEFAEQFKPKWISIEDRLPDDGKIYDIVIYWPEIKRQERRSSYVFKTKHDIVDWENYFQDNYYHLLGLYEMSFGVDENLITHYMEHVALPEPPETVK